MTYIDFIPYIVSGFLGMAIGWMLCCTLKRKEYVRYQDCLDLLMHVHTQAMVKIIHDIKLQLDDIKRTGRDTNYRVGGI